MGNWLEMSFEKNILLWDVFFLGLTMTECYLYYESCQLLLRILCFGFYKFWLQIA